MDSVKRRLKIKCPCCESTLTVDPKTGLVLHSDHKKSAVSFEDALKREQSKKDKSDEIFEKAFSDEKQRRSSLEDKFREALESKDELDEPPPRPWDFD